MAKAPTLSRAPLWAELVSVAATLTVSKVTQPLPAKHVADMFEVS